MLLLFFVLFLVSVSSDLLGMDNSKSIPLTTHTNQNYSTLTAALAASVSMPLLSQRTNLVADNKSRLITDDTSITGNSYNTLSVSPALTGYNASISHETFASITPRHQDDGITSDESNELGSRTLEQNESLSPLEQTIINDDEQGFNKILYQATNQDLKTALFLAVQLGKLKYLKKMLDYQEDLARITNPHKDTLLVHLLQTHKNREVDDIFRAMLSCLLLCEASPDAVNLKEENALMLAAKYFDKTVLHSLLYRSKQYGEFLLWLTKNGPFSQFDEVINIFSFNLNYRNERGKTALHICAEENLTNKMTKLLRKKGYGVSLNVNCQDIFGCTPLMIAIQKQSFEAAKLLLENGCALDIKDNHSLDALSYALLRSHNDSSHELIQLLLRYKSSLNEPVRGQTHLQTVAHKECFACTKALIKAGADRTQTDDEGNLFLTQAFDKNNCTYIGNCLHFFKTELLTPQDFKKFINHRNKIGNTMLMIAAIHGNTDFINLLFSYNSGCNMNIEHSTTANPLLRFDVDLDVQNDAGYTALMLALIYNHIPTAQLLLKAGADVTRLANDGQTAYQIASDKNHLECAHMIKELGNMTQQERLFWAARHGFKNHVNHLAPDIAYSLKHPLLTAHSQAEKIFDVRLGVYDDSGWTPLMYAAKNNDARMIVTLSNLESTITLPHLQSTISTQATIPQILLLKTRLPDVSGSTALIIAAKYNNLHAVRALIGLAQAYESFHLPTYLDAQDHYGKTAFNYAVENENFEIMNYLVRHGCHIDSVDKIGESSLMKAVKTRKNSSLKNLIAIGSQKNQRDLVGKTALMIALSNQQIEAATILLDSGVDVNCLDRTGKSAFSIALEQHSIPLMIHLKKLGADTRTSVIEEIINRLINTHSTEDDYLKSDTFLNNYASFFQAIDGNTTNIPRSGIFLNRGKIAAELTTHLQHLDLTTLNETIITLESPDTDFTTIQEILLRDCSQFHYTKKPFTLLMKLALMGATDALYALLSQTDHIDTVFIGKNAQKYINSQDRFGRTALMYAILAHNWPIVRMLISLKRTVTALHKSSEFTELTLCESGIFLRDNEGNSALEYAIATGNVEMIKEVLLATAFASIPTAEKPRCFKLRKKSVLLAFQLGYEPIGFNLLCLYYNQPSCFSRFGKVFGGSGVQGHSPKATELLRRISQINLLDAQ